MALHCWVMAIRQLGVERRFSYFDTYSMNISQSTITAQLFNSLSVGQHIDTDYRYLGLSKILAQSLGLSKFSMTVDLWICGDRRPSKAKSRRSDGMTLSERHHAMDGQTPGKIERI
jgi:hypothetical protein